MLTVKQDIPDFVLSSQLDNFIIGADKQVTFTLKKESSVILQETYTPDSNNEINVLDLFSLMEPYLLSSQLLQFSYSLSASGETAVNKSFIVLLCRHIVPCSADDFVNGYFLTALAGRDKVTSFGRTETLYLTTGQLASGGTTIPITVECIFVNEQNQLLSSTRSLGNVTDYGIRSVDVSPSRFTQSGYRLLRYTVLAGARRLTFRVDHGEPETVGLKFRNSFGVLETLYFAGGETVEPELTRSAAYFSGRYRTYHVDEQRKHTVSTGFIPQSMFLLADDVARSCEVYLMDSSGDIPVTIIESDTDRNDADDGLFSFTVAYIHASRCQQRMTLLPDIFDDSFDDTYN
ncbi:hypothetical protein [Phocaeicola barnesiae]